VARCSQRQDLAAGPRNTRRRLDSAAFPPGRVSCPPGPPHGIGVPVPRRRISSFRADPGLSKVLGLNPNSGSTLGLIFHWAESRKRFCRCSTSRNLAGGHIPFAHHATGKPELKTLARCTDPPRGAPSACAGQPPESEGAGPRFPFSFASLDPGTEVPGCVVRCANGRAVHQTFARGPARAGRPGPFCFSTFPDVGCVPTCFHHAALKDRRDGRQSPSWCSFLDEAHLLFTDASQAGSWKQVRADV